ncbi:MAG TPA: DUF4824 family protein [Burkholderiales bacterium]|jgi:hypothetical protein
MIWTRHHTLAAGLALIAATNAIVLAGVAYNRSGEPDAQLRLTDRELNAPYSWGFAKENSGLAMQLKWSLPVPARPPSDDGNEPGIAGPWGESSWLDRAKLAELGFDLSHAERIDDERYAEPLPRDVLLVLELDGPAYRGALVRAERRIAALEAKAAAQPNDRSAGSVPEWARRMRDELRDHASRLYVVDAGLDRDRLRAKYADRKRYAIANGRVNVLRTYGTKYRRNEVRGYVEQVNVDELNVPVELRATIGPDKGFEAVVSFGRRLEPWLVSATPRPKVAR